MSINIIFGFIIPWIFGYILYIKDRRMLLYITPFASAVSHTVNFWGFKSNFWRLVPLNLEDLASLPFNIGLFAVFPSYLIYYISKKKTNPYLLIVTFSILMTILEQIAVLFGWVMYFNGWNISWTFISYFIPYLIVYAFYSVSSMDISKWFDELYNNNHTWSLNCIL